MADSRRLLIVDDDDVIAVGLLDHLKLHGCQVDTARDYDRAKAIVANQDYTVAIVDILLTGRQTEDGVIFLRWLRTTSPETAVVVLTAYRTEWLEHFAFSLGISLVFDKPKRFDEIVHLVGTLMSKREHVPGETVL